MQQLGRFDEAIDALRQALAAGFDGDLDDHPSAQALIADLLLRAGHTQQADDAWLQAEHKDPRDPRLHQAAGVAYADVGLHGKALSQRASVGLAWFPDGQYQGALQTWPSFAEDYQHGPYEAYCARLELLLRNLRAQDIARLALTPITIDNYLAWCTCHDRDPEQSDTRANYATELLEHDDTRPWPPERNQP